MATSRTCLRLRTIAIASPRAMSLAPIVPTAFRTTAARSTQTVSRIATSRSYSSEASSPVEAPDYLDEGERKVFQMVKDRLNPTKLEVQDVSGGCGSMYALDIVSEKFKGLPIVKQHRLVNEVLGDELKKWHGVQLKTRAS